jgi:acetyl-CoA carboxylase biotin carboxyl carrier protein
MKAKEIRDLIEFISETGLEEVNIETPEFKIKVKRTPNIFSALGAATPAPVLMTSALASAPKQETPAPSIESNLLTIKSPMIGTFYDSSNPESPAFVKVGDSVKSGQPVCIIEAMKLFNEIESEISGKIVKILVDNAQPVEFDQPLFLVDPS